METTIHTTSPIADKDVTRLPPHQLRQKERASICWSLLPLWGSLPWGLVAITSKDPQLIHMMKTHSGTHRWLPPSLDVLGQSVMEAPL